MSSSGEGSVGKQNAQKSCGPRTEEGKRAASLNSSKHGITGKGIRPEVLAKSGIGESLFSPHVNLKNDPAFGTLVKREIAYCFVRLELLRKWESERIWPDDDLIGKRFSGAVLCDLGLSARYMTSLVNNISRLRSLLDADASSGSNNGV